jgi:hypothetical protein
MNNLIPIIEWLVDYHENPPRCCYTCLYYTQKECKKFKEVPPLDFKQEIDKCAAYRPKVPF